MTGVGEVAQRRQEPPLRAENERVMVTLGHLVTQLGGALPAGVLASPRGLDVELRGVSIYDAFAPEPDADGVVVLGIGLSASEAAGALDDLGLHGAGALLVKIRDESDVPKLTAAAEHSGVAVLTVPGAVGWARVQSLVVATLAEMTAVEVPDRAGRDPVDLFGIADTIAELVDAPILIQDRHMHVLAFSGRQDEADAVRAEVILQRGMPPRYARQLEELKILQRVLREHEPVYFAPLEGMDKGRLAVAVRAGNELLGTVTAAVSEPTDTQHRALAEAATLVALRLLHQRSLEDAEELHAADVVATLLEGGVGAAEAAVELGVEADGYRVMAAGIRRGEEVDDAALERRLRAALQSHLSLFRTRGAIALLGGVAYTVLPATEPARDRQRLAQLARNFTERTAGQVPERTLIGIGGHAPTLADLPRSRHEADDALRVLRTEPALGQVAEIDDVRLRSWLLRLRDVLGDEPVLGHGPLETVLAHDAAHGTAYVETLRAFLEEMGDTLRIAERLAIHVNTVRYRLRRLGEFEDLRLDDPDRRLELQLRLRLLADTDRRRTVQDG